MANIYVVDKKINTNIALIDFIEYTLLDLLQDWFKAYNWELSDKITTIENFIKMLQNNGESKALVYGNDMITIVNG